MEEGSLSSFIVPIESREIHVREKPVIREGKSRITEPLMGNTNTHRGKNECVNETTADSRAGRTQA